MFLHLLCYHLIGLTHTEHMNKILCWLAVGFYFTFPSGLVFC